MERKLKGHLALLKLLPLKKWTDDWLFSVWHDLPDESHVKAGAIPKAAKARSYGRSLAEILGCTGAAIGAS